MCGGVKQRIGDVIHDEKEKKLKLKFAVKMSNYSKDKIENLNFQELIGNYYIEPTLNDFSIFPNQFHNYTPYISQASSQEYINPIENNNLC